MKKKESLCCYNCHYWICLNMPSGPIYAKILNIAKFSSCRVLNMQALHSVLNSHYMPWQRFEYISGSKYARILNMAGFWLELHRILNMPQHGWICLTWTWICLNLCEFTVADRVLNMSHTIHTLYKLMSTFWEMGVFRTLSKI